MQPHGPYYLGGPDGHTPILCDDTDPIWIRQHAARDVYWRVARTEVLPAAVAVETSFIGHNLANPRQSRFFETRVSAPGYPQIHDHAARYKTWDEAGEGHAALVARVREHLRADDAYHSAAAPRVVLIGVGEPGRQVLGRLIAAGVPAADCVALDIEATAFAPSSALRCVHLDVGPLPVEPGRYQHPRSQPWPPTRSRSARIADWLRSGTAALPAMAEALCDAEFAILLTVLSGEEVSAADIAAALLRRLTFASTSDGVPVRRLMAVGIVMVLSPVAKEGWDSIDTRVRAMRHSLDTLLLIPSDPLAPADGPTAHSGDLDRVAIVATVLGLIALLRNPSTTEQARAALIQGDAARVGLGRAPRGADAAAMANALGSPLLEGVPRRGVHTLLFALDATQAEGAALALLDTFRPRFPNAASLHLSFQLTDSRATEARALALVVGQTDLHSSVLRPLEDAFRCDAREQDAQAAATFAEQEQRWTARYGPPSRQPDEILGERELEVLLRDAEGHWHANHTVAGGPVRMIVFRQPSIGMKGVSWWGRLPHPLEAWIIDVTGTRTSTPAETEALLEAKDTRQERRAEYNASMTYSLTPIADTPYVLREFRAGSTMGRGDVVRIDSEGGMLCIRMIWIS